MAAKKHQPSAEHLEALDKGRRASKAVRAYLELIRDLGQPRKRGRQIDWQKRYDDAATALEKEEDVMSQLRLTQQLLEAQENLNQADETDTAAIEAGFVEWAGWYSEQHGIGYNTWRQMGVAPEVLKHAGIRR